MLKNRELLDQQFFCWVFNSVIESSVGMAPSGSNAFSHYGESSSAGEGTQAFSIRGEGLSAGENFQAISIRGKRASVEGSGDDIESMERIAKRAKHLQAISISGDGASVEESGDDPESMARLAERTKQLLTEKLCVESKPLNVGVYFDDAVVMKIIGRLDFKSLFRAQVLSKTWQDNFQRDVFQREVQNSSSWKSYAPLYVNHKNEAVGYDSSSKEWQRLPSHSFAESVSKGWTLRAGAGALLCWTNPVSLASVDPNNYSKLVNEEDPFQVQVSNSLTKRWEQLSPRPTMCWPESVHAIRIPENNSYKVIIGTMDVGARGRESIRLQIYDSSNQSWTEACSMQLTRTQTISWGGEVLKDGVLYMLIYTLGRRPGDDKVTYELVTYDVASNKWAKRHLYKVFYESGNRYRQRLKFSDNHTSDLLVCGSNVMQVVSHVSQNVQVLSVFRLDVEAGSASEVATAPDEILDELETSISNFHFSAGKDDKLYIGGEYPHCSLISYNVETREWTWVYSAADGDVDLTRPDSTDVDMTFSSSFMDKFPASFSSPLGKWRWNRVAYQPGLNPFIEL